VGRGMSAMLVQPDSHRAAILSQMRRTRSRNHRPLRPLPSRRILLRLRSLRPALHAHFSRNHSPSEVRRSRLAREATRRHPERNSPTARIPGHANRTRPPTPLARARSRLQPGRTHRLSPRPPTLHPAPAPPKKHPQPNRPHPQRTQTQPGRSF